MVTVNQQCSKCKAFVWNSQSYMPHGKYPAGNMVLSLAVLMAGACISKVLLSFCHLGLCCYLPCTFISDQRSFIFPTVICHWKFYRAGPVNKLKDMKDVVWSRDGRFNSMGQLAKYGAYIMFSISIMKVVHFELLFQHYMTPGHIISPISMTGQTHKIDINCFNNNKLPNCLLLLDAHQHIAYIRNSCIYLFIGKISK